MKLREYQAQAITAIESEFTAGRGRTLLVLPTGCGKTIVFASVAARVAERGGRVLVLAHRDELLTQALDKIQGIAGIPCALEKAESHTAGTCVPITVASIQSMARVARLAEFRPDDFDLLVVDEAHHSLAEGYRRVIGYFGAARLLGVTATPDRADRRGLSEVYDSIAYEYTLAAAIRDGYLVDIVAKTLPLEIDASGLETSHGDYTAASAGHALDPYLEQIADVMADECRGRHTVVFLPLVATAKRMASLLRGRGLAAEEVDGGSENRAEVLARFGRGDTDVLCNAMLLTEGWDCPICDTIVVLRPTKSRALYSQMVGRGTRLCPETGKERLLLLDFLWLTGTHRLCRPASLFADRPDKARRMTDALGDGDARDLLGLEGEVERDILAEREAALAKELEAKRRSGRRLVDVVQFELSIGSDALANYSETFAWEMLAPTAAQVATLEKCGLDAAGMTRGKASTLLDVLAERRKRGMATPKQVRQLERAGFTHPGLWSFDEANDMMGRLASVGWKPYRLGFNTAAYVPASLGGDVR